MANNCCSGNECEELVTIGYMRNIPSATSVNFPCVEVSDATPIESCCEADESAYTPTYGDIMIEVSPNKGKYANIRKIDNDNPIRDINGFSARTTSTPIESCCGELNPNDALIPKSDFLFGWTVIKNIKFKVIKNVSFCDPSYEIEETDEYDRCIYSCDYVNTFSASVETTKSGALTKHYGDIRKNGCSATCEVTFDTARVYTSITTCEVTKSAESSFTLSSYEVVVGLLPYDGNDGRIPCSGGTISGNVVTECLNEVNIISVDTSPAVDAQITYDDGHFEITIPENYSGYSGITITVNFSVGDKNGSTSGCSYGWDACEYKPTTDNPCEIFWNFKECWNNPNRNVKEYDCKGKEITCNNKI